MAIVGAARPPREGREETGRRPHTAGPGSFIPKFLTAGVILCSLSFAGCARDPAPREISPVMHESKPPPHRAAAARPRRLRETIRYVQPNIRQPDPALLVAQPAPDCEFKRSDLKTIDPDEWARLKVEYERQCFQDAEKAARERLVLLQTQNFCEIEPVPHRKPAP
jgi:hypothetical protein